RNDYPKWKRSDASPGFYRSGRAEKPSRMAGRKEITMMNEALRQEALHSFVSFVQNINVGDSQFFYFRQPGLGVLFTLESSGLHSVVGLTVHFHLNDERLDLVAFQVGLPISSVTQIAKGAGDHFVVLRILF